MTIEPVFDEIRQRIRARHEWKSIEKRSMMVIRLPKTSGVFQISRTIFFSTVITQVQEVESRQRFISLSEERGQRQVHALLLTTNFFTHSTKLFNTLLRCYSFSDHPHKAFLLYKQIQKGSSSNSHSSFDSFTYTFLINTTTNSASLAIGTPIHGLVLKVGFQSHVYVQTALLNMYLSFGALTRASTVFDEMPQRNWVTWNVMITGLVRSGELDLAMTLFDEMPKRNVISWTGIIDGHVRMNRMSEGLALFRRMVACEGIKPTEITILAILPVVLSYGHLRFCSLIHGYAEKRGFLAMDIRVANSIIDAYAKCGCIVSASRFFEYEISGGRRNLVSWTSIISGFAMFGMGREAVEHFKRMEEAGLKPNRVTFLSLLNACSHQGLVEEGLTYFEEMASKYRVLADVKHYGCVVDMLGRTGRLKEAEEMALEIPSEIVNVVVWRTLLGACTIHGDVEMGERVTKKIMEMERGYGGDYALMHNICTGVGRYHDAEKVRSLMEKRNVFKPAGHSLV